MKTNWVFAWTVGAVLLIGTIVGITTASAQKISSSPSRGKLWLTAMDTDNDWNGFQAGIHSLHGSPSSTRQTPITTGLLMRRN
jgi:hypothetical protein